MNTQRNIKQIIANGVKAKRYKGLQTVVECNFMLLSQVRHFIEKSHRLKMEASAERNGFLIGRCWYADKKWNYHVDEKAYHASASVSA